MTDEYGVAEGDLKQGGGSSNKAKPTGTYTVTIEKAEVKKDKNGKLYAKWWNRVLLGQHKKQIIFEGYLPLSREGNAYNLARRNSFIKALGLKEGAKIPGTPGADDISVINGTIVDVNLEHEYENVPGQQYSVTTRNNGKLPDGVTMADVEGIAPSERATFYALSDEYDGLGGSDSSEEEWGLGF